MILKNLIYIYQLENYSKKRFLLFCYKNLNWFNLNKRSGLDWTIRAILIYLFVLFTYFLLAGTIFYLEFIYVLVAYLFFGFIALPYFIIFADILISPMVLFQKRRVINHAQNIISSNKKKGLITIGITGSFGKTSMKNILTTVLQEKYRVFIFPGNINTEIGVSQYLIKHQELLGRADILISEMGAYKKKDIEKLCYIINPDYSIITAIGESHLERFGSFEEIVVTKFELANATKKKVFLNICDENVKKYASFEIKSNVEVLKICGIKEISDIAYLKNFKGISFVYKKERFKTKLVADYAIDFLVISLEIADEFNLNILEKQTALGKIDFVPHRLEIIRNKSLNRIIIDDSYNGNYSGFLAGLDVLSRAEGRKVVLTPGIVELGKERSQIIHTKLADEYTKMADMVLLIKNENTHFIVERFKKIHYNSFKEYNNISDAHSDLINILKNGDTIVFQNDTTDNY